MSLLPIFQIMVQISLSLSLHVCARACACKCTGADPLVDKKSPKLVMGLGPSSTYLRMAAPRVSSPPNLIVPSLLSISGKKERKKQKKKNPHLLLPILFSWGNLALWFELGLCNLSMIIDYTFIHITLVCEIIAQLSMDRQDAICQKLHRSFNVIYGLFAWLIQDFSRICGFEWQTKVGDWKLCLREYPSSIWNDCLPFDLCN